MKLQLLTALTAVLLGACASSSDNDLASPVDRVADAATDVVTEDHATSDAGADATVDADSQPDAPIEPEDAGTTDAPDAGSSLASYERACVMLHGCLGIEGIRSCLISAQAMAHASEEENRFGVALESITMQGEPPPGPSRTLYLPSVMACVGSATDCTGVRSCVGDGAPCDPELFPPSCMGNALKHCVPNANGGFVATANCGQLGLQCLSSTSPLGAVAQCAEGACDLGTDPVCDGNTARNCFLGGWVYEACSSMPGTQCVITNVAGMPMARCQGDGAACDASHVPTCVGEDLHACVTDKLYTIDCAPDGACSVDPESGAAACWGSTLFCGPETCNGTLLEYCAKGQPRSVDCAEHGFGQCLVGDNGARCAPPLLRGPVAFP